MSSVDIPYTPPIDFPGSTILVTGGGSGIGLGLVKELLGRGSKVIIAGRRQNVLDEVKKELPQVHVIQADVTTASGRTRLRDEVLRSFPTLTALVNNAGILRLVPLKDETDDTWDERKLEIETNISAPVHLTSLLLPTLLKNSSASSPGAIVNLTSLYAFAPDAGYPAYSATKAFLHSFTQTARIHLKDTNVQVYEIAPPLVATAMSGGRGVAVTDFCRAVVDRLAAGEKEVGYGDAETNRLSDRKTLLQTIDQYTAMGLKVGYLQPYPSPNLK